VNGVQRSYVPISYPENLPGDPTVRRYLVTIHEVGNITDKAENVHTILTSRDFIAPAERVTVEAYNA